MCPRPPVRGDLPPACSRLSHQGNKAQSSALLTGVLPLWPWALGGWLEAAVQLWKGGALTPVPESCPRPPAWDALSECWPPTAPHSPRVLADSCPPGLQEEPGRFPTKGGGPSAAVPRRARLFSLLPVCPGPWRPASGGPFSPRPCPFALHFSRAQSPLGLRDTLVVSGFPAGEAGVGLVASPRAAHLLSVSLPSPVTPREKESEHRLGGEG